MAGLPGVDEALELVLARVLALGPEDVPVARASGRFLAADVCSVVDLPPFESSAMDGYAVRAADTPGWLRVVGQSAAGAPLRRRLDGGEAVAISTGAVVPEGADAVVPVERAVVEADGVRLAGVESGAHVRGRAGDVAAGSVVGRAGARLGPPQVGALAAAGLAAVPCARCPRVAILPTGSELRRPGEELGPGQIYESNTALIAASVRAAGGVPEVLDAVSDDPDATRAALRRGLAADVLVTSGGVSVGTHDLVRGLVQELEAEEVFSGVAVRPGKPLLFAVCGPRLVFGLPGNPVSTLVGSELFVRPALLALQGAEDPRPPYLPGRLTSSLRRNELRDVFVRARVRNVGTHIELAPLAGQESHMIARAFEAEALIRLPRGAGSLEAGELVNYLRL